MDVSKGLRQCKLSFEPPNDGIHVCLNPRCFAPPEVLSKQNTGTIHAKASAQILCLICGTVFLVFSCFLFFSSFLYSSGGAASAQNIGDPSARSTSDLYLFKGQRKGLSDAAHRFAVPDRITNKREKSRQIMRRLEQTCPLLSGFTFR